ncbi:hypothetical protein TSUD_334110 [Trifolium subterraneum]|uniref:Terpene synthase N-terminal domain-containing protein n=1 Tax=Trifolium subterraneum TaxID=3900 RepID=A0A2Z6LUT9_TRISU|nr:hypothetical protein TSUD_334110 [Trifolium subterraneum]
MEDGEISISAYDTAWVALVKNIDDENKPQFPSSLQWIANNQLPDGSWGDELFLAHDRILNTLACVIALRSWNIHPNKCEKGMKFFVENLYKLEDENVEHMPIGFEIVFPSLLNIARSLNIQIPDDSPFIKDIFAMRDQKLRKIPREVLHNVPTTLLHSLEGMQNLDWNQLLKLQSQDGSFLFSPSSTAIALMQTKDENALNYLAKIVNKFNGGVPNVFPVDLFEHLWAVDRLERLGISRYFQQEIENCVNYVSRYWTDKGICWARNSEVQDIDDTAMGFRLLRLHGHQVSADVFKHFEKSGQFFCFPGQLNQAVTGMFNTYRASQVGYALDVPWYASLPRLETRFYLEHYGGKNDIWIGKTLYRMPFVNNDVYLELAKLDYNNCQAMHCKEWEEDIQRWYLESKLEGFGLSKKSLLFAYYVAAASIFEPERSLERLAWTKTAALLQTLKSHLKDEETRSTFVDKFNKYINGGDYSNRWLNKNKREDKLLGVLVTTLDQLGFQMFWNHDQENSNYLNQMWQNWLSSWHNEGNRSEREAELLVQIINLTAGYWPEELQSNPQYQKLLEAHTSINSPQIESEMQELVQLVLQNSPDSLHSNIKNSFLMVAKSFYYEAYCDPETIYSHIDKVLFQKVN